MQKTRFKKPLSLIVCFVLIAAMALFTTGCNGNKTNADTTAPETTQGENGVEATEIGEGSVNFTLTVTDGEGKESAFSVSTDKKTVGEALLELGLIDGDKGEYGLYVKTVNGETVDYDTDGKYWAFYVNGEYATSGADTTEIVGGATYSFKVEV